MNTLDLLAGTGNDQQTLRKALGRFATGVTVVTTANLAEAASRA